jgi:D-sedoheptulose 7-phosphate isomerase
MQKLFSLYANNFIHLLSNFDWNALTPLANAFHECWQNGRQIFICGNGGSAGNAIHLANDYSYGCAKNAKRALRVQSLSANPAVMTCLANDEDYSQIYSLQLRSYAQAGDLLIVLSGSGNSANIINAIKEAQQLKMTTAGILGYDGGCALSMVDIAIHSQIDDMQISEDFQLVVGHMIMKWLSENVPESLRKETLTEEVEAHA